MTEYEISYLLTESLGVLWSSVQFWSGVTFGYMALSYIAAKHLNVLSISIVTVLYCLFSYVMLTVLQAMGHVVVGHLADLQALQDTGGLKTQAARNHIEAGGFMNEKIFVATIIGTFAASVLYMPYNYFVSRREHT
jgi:hypothetical protein